MARQELCTFAVGCSNVAMTEAVMHRCRIDPNGRYCCIILS